MRIFFPGAGLFVLSAWCLGVLNSHGKFFLSYAAPVVWNLAIIAALLFYGGRVGETDLVRRGRLGLGRRCGAAGAGAAAHGDAPC